ncbi:glutamine--tRNA ligase/YqeY domain fusion protein [Candidatus Haliotispira prima]|uniref:Glutamine--tRNA ligase n=1 Tax=Candidatus Haliotispira prima TaxID=3034016 RepID=A0ABY8MFT5_9SPIO|nr:glutamine--tRNA ligase/YqeY domain fusion protein [Candidatus Haliotispira prima]
MTIDNPEDNSSQSIANSQSSLGPTDPGPDFIRKIVTEDIRSGRCGKVVTRFPPEPNGYLHIGHAKAMSISADIAAENGGDFILRMDDTNPVNEEQQFIQAIEQDVAWLGFRWKTAESGEAYYASNYFGIFYDFACYLAGQGLAYVDELDGETMNLYRGSPTVPGKDSPHRERPAAESLALLEEMNLGQHPEGTYTLRAKIDMQHVNVHMRDPVIYRIKYLDHPRLQGRCCLFPMYDFAHPLEDAIEQISHSLCSLEFENHRPTYDWFVDKFHDFRGSGGRSGPRQYEFARLAMGYTTMSKRALRTLVEQGLVDGWDDPRLPTVCGMRRRGFPAPALLAFVRAVGITKVPGMIGPEFLWHHVREYLNRFALRRFAVIDPIKVVIENYGEDQSEEFLSENNPEDSEAGQRPLRFGRELWIERNDFMEEPPKKYFRLAPGREVRLKHAYYITCNKVIKDEQGRVLELLCRYDPESRGGSAPDGRKVKGTIHWLNCKDARPAEFRLYDLLFTRENMADLEEGKSYVDYLNPDSLVVRQGYVEPALGQLSGGERQAAMQFLRLGYFIADSKDYSPEKPVFNRAVGLRDAWAKEVKQQNAKKST